jgi:intein/homing endonuclease
MADANDKTASVPAPEGSGLVTSNLDAEFKMIKNAVSPGLTGSALVDIPRARMKKMASQFGNMRPGLHRQAPSFYHPLFEALNLQLPTKTREIDQWARHFYKTDGYVGTVIDMHCFAAGSAVYTMNDVVNIEDVKEGDSVPGLDGRAKVVKHAESHHYDGTLYTVKPFCLPELKVTHNEGLWVVHGRYMDHMPRLDKCGKIRNDCGRWMPDGGPSWVRAEDVRPGDYLFFPKRIPTNKAVEFDLSKFIRERSVKYDMTIRNQTGVGFPQTDRSHKVSLMEVQGDTILSIKSGSRIPRKVIADDDLCELGGWWAAEGYSDGGAIYFCLGTHEPNNIARVSELIRKVFKMEPKVMITKETHGAKVYVCSRLLSKWFCSEFGLGAQNKRVPQWIMDGESSWMRKFLIGYLNGDGCMADEFCVKSNTVSRTLAYQMEVLAARLGFLFSIKTITSRKDGQKRKPIYYMRASKTEVLPKVYGIAHESARSPRKTYHEAPGGFLVKVRDVRKKKFSGTVYDITTEDGSFCAPIVVHNSDLPMTGAHLVCDDEKVKLFFEILFFDVIKGLNLIGDVSHEWWKLGNVFPFGEWDDDRGIWTGFNLLNPDFVEVEKSSLVGEPILKLDPDDNLKRIVASRQPKELYEALAKIENGQLVNLVARGEKIPLNKFRVSHLAYKMSPYESVGTPIMFRAFKPLIFKDLVRRVQQAVYERHITPIKLVKVGTDTMPANPQAVTQVREAFDELSQDLSAWFVYHHAISVEYVSSAGKIHPFDQESKWIREEIMAALMGSEAMIGGTGPNFAAGSIGLQVLINRYMRCQEMLARWIKDTIFRPVAIAQDFRRRNELGEDEYIVPDIEFEFMKLKDDVQMKGLMKEMAKTGLISKQTFYTYLGLDYRKEKRQIERERAEEKKAAMQGMKPGGKPGAGGAGAPPPMGGGGGGDSGGGEGPVPGEGETAATVPTPGTPMPAAETIPGAGAGQGLPEAA